MGIINVISMVVEPWFTINIINNRIMTSAHEGVIFGQRVYPPLYSSLVDFHGHNMGKRVVARPTTTL